MFLLNYAIKNGAWVSSLPMFLQNVFTYPMLVYSIALIIVIMFRPKGIMGSREFALCDIPKWPTLLRARFAAAARPKQRRRRCSTMAEQKTPVLETRKLGISFGGLKAVQDFNLQMYQGELVGLIGPNGAGKTTVFNLLTGVYVPTEGTVLLDGTPLNGKKTHQFVAAGIAGPSRTSGCSGT